MTVIVTMEHIRAAKICSSGARTFFNRHGIDWTAFLNDGVPEEVLLQTGDAQAARVVEIARAEHERVEAERHGRQ